MSVDLWKEIIKMPIYKRCAICGRLCEQNEEMSAEPYKKGYACQPCFINTVIPSRKWKADKYNRYAKQV